MNSEKEIILSATDKANKRELSFEEANDIVSKYPQSHRAHALLAFLYLQRNEFEKVVEQIKESLKYGESVTAFNLSAHANIKLKNNEAAKADYLSALELDANDYMSMANYAVFQGQMGEFEEAINTIRRLTLLKPNDLAMKTKLVTMYLTISDFEGAANYLEDVIKEFPNEYIFQHMLGNAYYQSDRKEKAVEYYKNAIKIKPDAAKSYLNIAQYHYENEDMVVIQWDDLRTYDNNGAYRETFEIILYNKANFPPTLTGDSEIKIQYQEFNNTSDGYYPNGQGTPVHGCYSTIGIENHLGDTGLEVTFNNIFHPAATRIIDGSAIFITTGRPPRTSISIQNVDINNGMLDIYFENQEPVSGFQFELFGLSVDNASGGLAEENGFITSTSAQMVLGFSTDGSVVPAGEGILTKVYFSDYLGEEICFGINPASNVISNVSGQFLTTDWGECYLPSQLQGDMNTDGTLDILDLVSIVNIILSNSFDSLGDMNADGELNILDLVNLINIILS